MDKTLEKYPGTIGVSNDVVVFGKDKKKEHDGNFLNLMDASKENGLIFNCTKCNIKTKPTNLFEGIYDKKEVHPDPQKQKALKP